MAVFFVNSCSWSNCGLTFSSLSDLIRHIESTHLDYDSPKLEQKIRPDQTRCLPVSCILRMFNDPVDQLYPPTPVLVSPSLQAANHPPHRGKRPLSPATSLCSTATPTGSEMDDENGSESAESTDSWMKNPDSGSALLKMMAGGTPVPIDSKNDKPFICPVSGCNKRYRNSSGLNCHSKNTHGPPPTQPTDANNVVPKVEKPYSCSFCGRLYKTAHGMRQHKMTNHKAEMMASTIGSAPAQTSPSLKELPGPSPVVAPPTPVLAHQAVRSTSSQCIQAPKDTVSAGNTSLMATQLMTQQNQAQTPVNNPPSLSLPQNTIPIVPTISGTTTSCVQGKEAMDTNSVLANYVKTKALKTNHNQSPSTSSQSSESMTQILLPFTPPLTSVSTASNPTAAPMSAPPKSIKAPMLQRQLMSPLKPLSSLIKEGASGLSAIVAGSVPSAVAK